MDFRSKATLLLYLLLVIPSLSVEEGIGDGDGDGVAPLYSLPKVGLRTGSRKVLGLDTVLDYDYAGPNPKHDPRKGRPPGGRNP